MRSTEKLLSDIADSCRLITEFVRGMDRAAVRSGCENAVGYSVLNCHYWRSATTDIPALSQFIAPFVTPLLNEDEAE